MFNLRLERYNNSKLKKVKCMKDGVNLFPVSGTENGFPLELRLENGVVNTRMQKCFII